MAAYIAGAAITLFAIGLEKSVGRPGQEAASPQAGCYGPEGTSLLAC